MAKDKFTPSGFTPAELDVLEDAVQALTICENHFRLRDKANAQLHLAAPKYSPITKMVAKAARQLAILIDGGQIASENEDSEVHETEPSVEPVDQTLE